MQSREYQKLFRHYKDVHKAVEVDPRDVIVWAVDHRLLDLPDVDPIAVAAKSLSRALREEVRRDGTTGRPYRANVSVTPDNPRQPTLWGDIDEVDRKFAHKAFQLRRKQMVGDAVQLSLDLDHWNSAHPKEGPIALVLDFTDDVEEAKVMMAPPDDGDAALIN